MILKLIISNFLIVSYHSLAHRLQDIFFLHFDQYPVLKTDQLQKRYMYFILLILDRLPSPKITRISYFYMHT